jgi:UDP-glucose 4-epimerase
MHPRRDKAVVTGGAGFIGSRLVDHLLSTTSTDVVVLDSLTRGRLSSNSAHLFNPRFQFIKGDIRDRRAVTEAVSGARWVFHLAAESTVIGALADLDSCFQTNALGTLNVLRASADTGVERVVIASSREVYGESISLPVDENAPLLPVSSYGASKVSCETICRAFRRERGLTSVILRLANVYGQGDSGRVIPEWLHSAVKGDPLTVYGGKQVIDFVWVGHVVEAFVRAATVEGPLPPINVASGTGTRILDVARRIIRETSSRSEIKIQAARPMDVTRFVANVQRMRQLLAVEPALDPLSRLSELINGAIGVAA